MYFVVSKRAITSLCIPKSQSPLTVIRIVAVEGIIVQI